MTGRIGMEWFRWALGRVPPISGSQKTVRCDEVPVVFREPAILTGYRRTGKPWSYYANSIFQVHNETFNIWSHGIGFCLFTACIAWYGRRIGWGADPTYWALLGFGITALVYTSVSTFGHTFHSRSEINHYTCFQVDYIGTGTYAQGTGILAYYCSGCVSFYQSMFSPVYVQINTLLGFTSCICCIVAKLRYRRPYPVQRRLLQMSSGFLHSLLLCVPVAYRIRDCWTGVECAPYGLVLHVTSICTMAMSVFFFSSHLPEKLRPGQFDLLANGHQIFHVLIIITTLLQFEGGYRDIQQIPRQTRLMAQPEMITIFGSICVVMLADFIVIYMLRTKVEGVVAQNAILEKGRKQH